MFNRILMYVATAVLVAFCSKGGNLNDNTPKAEVKLLSPSSVTIPSAGGETAIEFETSEDWAISATIPGADNGKDYA